MKPYFTLGNGLASLFMCYIGIRLLTLHAHSNYLPKYATISLGIVILIFSLIGVVIRISNHFKKNKHH